MPSVFLDSCRDQSPRCGGEGRRPSSLRLDRLNRIQAKGRIPYRQLLDSRPYWKQSFRAQRAAASSWDASAGVLGNVAQRMQ
jgi:hypothetical protein